MSEFYVEQDNRQMADDGIEFFPTHFDREQSMVVRPHIHTAVEILFIINGTFRVYADDVEYMLSEGDAILFRSNTIHKVYNVDGDEPYYYCLKLRPSLILELSSSGCGIGYLLRLAFTNRDEKTVWKRCECESLGIADALESLISEHSTRRYGYDISMKVSAARILLLMLRDIELAHNHRLSENVADDNLKRRIYNAIVYINAHYAEELTAEQCGRLQYMSYSYFSRSFKRITGISFKDYLNHVRINHAEKSLLSSEKTITEISAECGFNNVSYFISIYKRIKGVTPSVSRERKNNNESGQF